MPFARQRPAAPARDLYVTSVLRNLAPLRLAALFVLGLCASASAFAQDILDQVGETIRARNRLKRQVAALTAEGRISAMVLGFLPIGMGLILFSSNPDYMKPLFSRTIGLIMLGVAVALLVAGALWLKKLIDVEY